MKKLMILGLLATTLAFADDASPNKVASMMQTPAMAQTETETVKAFYGYVNLGLGPFPIPMPIFGVGGRFQNGHHGFDGSLQFTSFGSGFTLLKENIDYLYFFKPNLASQFYIGGGVSTSEVISHGRVRAFLSPQVVLGKQYTNKAGGVRYFQAQVDPVFLNLNRAHKHRHTRVGSFPCVILSYGICF